MTHLLPQLNDVRRKVDEIQSQLTGSIGRDLNGQPVIQNHAAFLSGFQGVVTALPVILNVLEAVLHALGPQGQNVPTAPQNAPAGRASIYAEPNGPTPEPQAQTPGIRVEQAPADDKTQTEAPAEETKGE